MTGLQINIYTGVGIPWVAGLLSLIGRVCARRMTKRPWGLEDYFCISAFVFATAYGSLLLEWTINWSLGQYLHESITSPSSQRILTKSRKFAFFSSLTYAFSIASSKLAILSLYWRVFQVTSIRWPIIIVAALAATWLVLRTFLVIFRCHPVDYYWDKTISGSCSIKDSDFFFGTVLTHFIMDVIILVLPIIEVFKLRLRVGQKIAVAALFGIGVIVCIASVFVLIESMKSDPNTIQMTYDYAMNYVWGSVEINMAIVSACFPLLRPIFRYVLGSKALNSYTSHPFSHPTCALELPTIPQSKRDTDLDGASSVRGLADEETSPGYASDPGGSASAATLPRPERVHTTVSSPAARVISWDFGNDDVNNIHVRKDVTVQIKDPKRR